MSEALFASNDDMHGVSAEVRPTTDVTDNEWQDIHQVHIESLRAKVPKHEWDRIDVITKAGDLATYRDRRVNPNLQAGKDGWRKEQLFKDPMIVISRDLNHEIIGAALVAENTSGKGLMWKAEAKLKMLESSGSKRYIHLREAFVHPDAQPAMEVEDNVIAVSGITLMAISLLLKNNNYNPDQKVAAYVVTNDPADEDFYNITQAIGLSQTSAPTPTSYPGYSEDAETIRVQSGLRDIQKAIPALRSGNNR